MNVRAPSPAGSKACDNACSTRKRADTWFSASWRAKLLTTLTSNLPEFSRTHCVLHGLGQLLQRERLWQEGEIGLTLEVLLEGILGIAGDEHNLGADPTATQLPEQRRAVHLRHHHVGKNEIDCI